jgi:hypothetical protein
VDAYTSAVERGLYVVIVEGRDEAEAERAQDVLHGMEASDLNLLRRTGERRLRDVVAERQALADSEGGMGTGARGHGVRRQADVRREGESSRRARAGARHGLARLGRAAHAGSGAPGEQRPIASPDLPRTDSDKPR